MIATLILASATTDLSTAVAWAKTENIAFDADYPPEAIRRGDNGRVRVKLTINEFGKPVRCELTDSNGSASLNVRTCAILMIRTSFTPAHDRDGTPIYGQLFHTISWSLPGTKGLRPPMGSRPDVALSVKSLPNKQQIAQVPVRILLDIDGRAIFCAVNEGTPDLALNKAFCPAVLANNKFGAVLDLNGKPTRAMLTLRVAFIVEGSSQAPRN